jgi:hypothetical protein
MLLMFLDTQGWSKIDEFLPQAAGVILLLMLSVTV